MKLLAFITYLALTVLAPDAFGADLKPIGNNCNVASPPEGYGEIVDGSFYTMSPFAVFPRAKDINRTYRGCQIIWMADPQEIKFPLDWMPFLWVELENGTVVRTWSPNPAFSESNKCRFASGRLVTGNLKECISIANFPLKSMRSGCLKAMLRIDNSEDGLRGCRNEE